MPTPATLSISIVSYNTRADLLACLDSIYSHPPRRSIRVVVVDNGSADGSVDAVRQQFPQTEIIETGENLGYGRANNRGLLNSGSEFYAILNSDLFVHPGSLDACCDHLEAHSDAGIVGGALLNPDGSPQMDWAAGELNLAAIIAEQWFLAPIFRRFGLFGDYFRSNWPRDDTRALPQVCGAFMVLRGSLYDSLGGFDPAYFMYCEDTDLCRRIRNRGLKCVYLHDATATHGHGKSSAGALRARMVLEHNISRCIYMRKFQGFGRALLAQYVMIVGAWLRYRIWTLAGRILRRPQMFAKGKGYADVLRGTMATDVRQGKR